MDEVYWVTSQYRFELVHELSSILQAFLVGIVKAFR